MVLYVVYGIFLHWFSQLAARMEQYINGSRDLVDQAYTKIVRTYSKLDYSAVKVIPKSNAQPLMHLTHGGHFVSLQSTFMLYYQKYSLLT
jgi:hypothetical protein